MACFEVCPACGSDDVNVNRKRGAASCNGCGHVSSPDSAPDFLPPTPTSLVARCQRLANSPDWLQALAEQWPTPIAHEYQRLRALLAADKPDITGAIWQLKDVAEVLLKFPTLVMFRDLCCNEAPGVGTEIKRRLLGKPLSMGDWASIGLDLSRRISRSENSMLMSRSVAGLFCDRKSEATPVMHLLQDLVRWRNDEIGHGAFRMDPQELVLSLETWIPQLNAACAGFQHIWGALELVRSEASASDTQRILKGCNALHEHHHRDDQQGKMEELGLAGPDGRMLPLSPYVSLRLCPECAHRDVFFFDTYKGDSRRSFFLDYYRGHRISLADHMDRALNQDLALLLRKLGSAQDPAGSVDADASHMRRSVVDLLEAQQLEASVLSPEYLHQPLQAFLSSHSKGIFWLRASGHVGKTLFTQSVLKQHAKQHSLCCGFYIKREYHVHPAQFAEGLGTALRAREMLDISAGSKALPELASDVEPAQAPEAFIAWISAMRRLSAKGEQTLLICIDGLDELPDSAGQLGIADYLPNAAQLPEGVYLLLTSRPAGECPPWLTQRLQAGLAKGPCMLELEIDPRTHTGYHALMRAYFYQHLDAQWKQDLLERSAGPAKGQPKPAPGMPESMRRFALNMVQPGQAVNWALANAVFADFESCFDRLLEKAEFRFLFFSYLVDTLAGLADWKVIEGVPPGEQMFTQFLEQLDTHLTGKLNTLAMRVLLTLAATEEVHAWQQGWHLRSTPWNGLPLGLLADLLQDSENGAEGSAISNRLVFVLYTLKTVLASYKAGASSGTHFSLGLKGLGDTLRRLRPDGLDQVHAQIGRQFLDEWSGRFGSIPEHDLSAQYALQTVLGHADLGNDAALKADVLANMELVNAGWVGKAQQALARNDSAQALLWLDLVIEMQRRLLAAGSDAVDMDMLALLYFRNRRNRATLCGQQGLAWSALKALEALRQDIGSLMASSAGTGKANAGDILLEFLLSLEQSGWIQLTALQDFGAAEQSCRSCLQLLMANARPDAPLAMRLDLSFIHLRVQLNLAKCLRAQKRMADWKSTLAAVQNDLAHVQASQWMPARTTVLQALFTLEACQEARAEGDFLAPLQQALTNLQALPPEEQQGDYTAVLAATLSAMAEIYRERGDLPEWLRCADAAVAVLRPRSENDLFLQEQLAQALLRLGSAQAALGEKSIALNDAKDVYVRMEQQLAGAEPSPGVQGSQNALQHNLSELQRRARREQAWEPVQHALDAAEAMDLDENAEEGLHAWQAARTGLDHYLAGLAQAGTDPDANAQYQAAVCHMKMGTARFNLALPDEARQDFERAVHRFDTLQAAHDRQQRYLASNLATCLQWLAYLDASSGQEAEALAYYLRSLAVIVPAIEAGNWEDTDVFFSGACRSLVLAIGLLREADLRTVLLHLQHMQHLANGSTLASVLDLAREQLADLPLNLRAALQHNPGGLEAGFLSRIGLQD